MEYQKKAGDAKEYRVIIPLFSALDSSYEGSRVASACERPCVCVCVCRHGKSAALDFTGKSLERNIEALFKKALAA